MKQLILFVTIAVGGIACTESQPAERRPELPAIAHPERVEIRKSFSDIPVNSSAFCKDPAGSNCVQLYQLLLAQLTVIDPIPVPQSTIGASISTVEAIDLYKAFVAQHPGEPIVAVFRQLYPRILLTKYGILDGTDYTQIRYFTQELIEAKSYDYTLLTAALKKLKPHLALDQFNAMKAGALEAARRQKTRHETEIAGLSDTTTTGRYGDKMSARLFPKEIRAHFLAEHKSDYATLLKNLDELNRL